MRSGPRKVKERHGTPHDSLHIPLEHEKCFGGIKNQKHKAFYCFQSGTTGFLSRKS